MQLSRVGQALSGACPRPSAAAARPPRRGHEAGPQVGPPGSGCGCGALASPRLPCAGSSSLTRRAATPPRASNGTSNHNTGSSGSNTSSTSSGKRGERAIASAAAPTHSAMLQLEVEAAAAAAAAVANQMPPADAAASSGGGGSGGGSSDEDAQPSGSESGGSVFSRVRARGEKTEAAAASVSRCQSSEAMAVSASASASATQAATRSSSSTRSPRTPAGPASSTTGALSDVNPYPACAWPAPANGSAGSKAEAAAMAAAAAAAAESPGAAWQPRATPGAGAASASSSSLDDSRSSIDNDAAQAAAAALMASHTNPFVNDAGKPNSLAWVAVGLMAIAYADWACNCFAIPTMLPDISNSLGMGDVQGGLLTTGYTYMFAASMIPVGLLADRVNRFKLLGAGVAAWSGITFLSGSATSFAELISLRLGFAVAQAAQNPVSLSLVPDLFPQNKNAALAVYNSALYMGRALSYSAALAADRINDAGAAAGVVGATAEAGWREMLRFVALPGLAVAAALALMPEQRAAGGVATLEASAATASEDGDDAAEPFKVMSLLKSKAFVLTTLGASFTDMGYYALGAFQASFYERAYDLDPSMYAPTLSILLPIGGIVGGIGGGYIADKAAEWGLPRALTTAGSAGLASPFLLLSMLSPTATGSFVGLLFGLSLSEAWRAPAANMARSTAPAQYGSSTLSLYLCMRNVVGGLGPLGVAYLSQALGGDLQHAMVVIPAAYAMSGLMFFAADKAFDEPGAAKA